MDLNIVTMTLNPAFDVHCETEEFLPEHENHFRGCIRNIGGKGLNVARALLKNGMQSVSFIVLGRQNSSDFEDEIKKSGIFYVPVYSDGRIRENITIHPRNASETRISFDDFEPDKSSVEKIFRMASEKCNRNTIFIFAGRLPAGIDSFFVIPFLCEIKNKGARLVIDSSSFGVSDIAKIKPWLIKPNEEELFALTKTDISSFDNAFYAADKLKSVGVENVMASLGGRGALLISDSTRCRVSVPTLSVLSTIGAGDSSIAGFCAAFAEGKSPEDCLVNAAAYGSAACLTEGTNPPEPNEIERIRKMVKLDIV